jgi:hypothetical protein
LSLSKYKQKEHSMRKLKMKLMDGKQYTFSTLSRKQMLAVQDKQNSEQYKEMQRLSAQEQKEGLEPEDLKKLAQLEESIENKMMTIFRLSLGVTHKEFLPLEDLEKDKEIADKLTELIDMRDIRIVTGFALNGTVNIEEEAIFSNADIVL